MKALFELIVPVGIAWVGVYGGAGVIGQMPGGIDINIGTLVGNLGIVGVLVWHMWYHTTKTYPMMIDRFSVEAEKLRTTFEKEQEASRRSAEKEMTEMRSMLMQNLTATRTAVHDVRDTAQGVINRIAVSEEKARAGG